MKDERYTIMSSTLGKYTIFDEEEGKPLTAKEVTDLLNTQTHHTHQLLDEVYSYKKKVEETLQEAYNQNARHHTPIATGVCVMLINIAKELGVEIN